LVLKSGAGSDAQSHGLNDGDEIHAPNHALRRPSVARKSCKGQIFLDKTRFPDNLAGMTRAFAISLCAGLLAGVPWPLEANDSEALDLARKLNTAFIEVAETVTPSVVVI